MHVKLKDKIKLKRKYAMMENLNVEIKYKTKHNQYYFR